MSAKQADNFIESFEHVSGVRLTHDALASFVNENPDQSPPLAWWHPDEPELGDQIASRVAAYVCGEPWPTYGDNADLDAYLVILRAAAVTRGYRVTSWRRYSK